MEIDWRWPQCGSWVATGVDLLTLMLIETNNHTLSKLGAHSGGNGVGCVNYNKDKGNWRQLEAIGVGCMNYNYYGGKWSWVHEL